MFQGQIGQKCGRYNKLGVAALSTDEGIVPALVQTPLFFQKFLKSSTYYIARTKRSIQNVRSVRLRASMRQGCICGGKRAECTLNRGLGLGG